MEIKGKVTEVSPTQQISESLKKRELIVEYAENVQYPEYLRFEAINDRCALLDTVRPGDDVEVFFNLRGRPWTDKTGKKSYFNSLALWNVNVLVQSNYMPSNNIGSGVSSDDDSGLPF